MRDLVKLHGGEVRAESTAGRGSTFTVTLPGGSAHLPSDRVVRTDIPEALATTARPFLDEALRWTAEDEIETPSDARLTADPTRTQPGPRPRVLVVDDNSDMRDYLRRLLAIHYEVWAASDGQAALDLLERQRPDVILSDVMMSRVGTEIFGVLFQRRSSERSLHIVTCVGNYRVNIATMTFHKAAGTAHELSDLPNLSFALAAQLRKLGINSPVALRSVEAEDAWLSVQAASGPHGMQVLLALEGAIQNVEWRELPGGRRSELLRFASTHVADLSAA